MAETRGTFQGNLQGTPSRPLEMLTSSKALTASYALEAEKLSTAEVGGESQSIYVSDGKPVALSSTIGSKTKPVYISGGKFTPADDIPTGKTGSWDNAASWLATNSGSISGITSSVVDLNTDVERFIEKSASWDSSSNWVKTNSASLLSRTSSLTISESLGTPAATNVQYTPDGGNKTIDIKVPSTPAHIGAAPASHTHSISDVTGLSDISSSVVRLESSASAIKTEVADTYLPLTGGTITGDLVVNQNLTVKGTTVSIDAQNLNVKDKLILVASGSTTQAAADGAGMAVATASAGEGGAARIQYESAGNRFTSSVNFAAPGFTGSLRGNVVGNVTGTASFATSASRAISAASADSATSASYAANATNAISASEATHAVTASWALDSKHANTASIALLANSATSASYASNATNATNATSASRAESAAQADSAASATTATTASYNAAGSSALAWITTKSASLVTESVWIRGTGKDSARLSTQNTASGEGSVAFGVSEWGGNVVAEGTGSLAHGLSSKADGNFSYAGGYFASASGTGSHAEGSFTKAKASCSHAEGSATIASGTYSHAEGNYSIAFGDASHAEGENCAARGQGSHAEGSASIASGIYSHAEGQRASASGYAAHAEGIFNISDASGSHAEGYASKARGCASHTEGGYTVASYSYAHAEGNYTLAARSACHAEGYLTTASADYAHAEGTSAKALGQAAHAEGYGSVASASCSHAEGDHTIATNSSEHAQGRYNVTASGQIFSIGIGVTNTLRRNAVSIITSSNPSASTYIYGVGTYDGTNPQPGVNDLATVIASAEGPWTKGTGESSAQLGIAVTASGTNSVAMGSGSVASGTNSHAEGLYTIALGAYSHAEGKYNATASGQLFSIGAGDAEARRKNAVTIITGSNSSASIFVYGIGGYDGTNPTVGTNDLATVINNILQRLDSLQ